MAKFKLYLYFASRADWVGNIMKEGLKPTSIHGSDEKGYCSSSILPMQSSTAFTS